MAEKSKSQLYEVEGKLYWAKLFEHNRDKNEDFHGPGGAYTVDVLLEKDQLDIVTKSGSRLKPKMVDEGIVIRFKRKHIHPAGIDELGGPPRVADKDKNLWDEGTLIGNGSIGKVYFTVYETKMGNGTRLEGVQVTDLVEYEVDDSEKQGVKLPF